MDVYPPAEDTFLLLKFLESIKSATYSCEIGSGSGVITEKLLNISERALATDIDFKACEATWKRTKKSYKLDVICCDSLTSIREIEMFDLIVSNPPYLPYEGEHSSWSGGKGGIEVPLKFVKDGLRRLKKGGKIAMVLSSLSSIEELVSALPSDVKVERPIKAKLGLFEELYIIEISRK
ncbi:MAG: hypothetical protein DRJ41_00825 [Thermoprotei archaeon]|nr:MAG: hypothetical protein DRJ41_00825 [Thermoprotei archaeon]